jgi:hypothetical protein
MIVLSGFAAAGAAASQGQKFPAFRARPELEAFIKSRASEVKGRIARAAFDYFRKAKKK